MVGRSGSLGSEAEPEGESGSTEPVEQSKAKGEVATESEALEVVSEDRVGFYTRNEELANTITHAFGALLAVAGLYLLVVRSLATGEVWKVVTCVIFGISLVLAYTASALYHGIQDRRWKGIMRSIDLVTIYFLIAGTYTPFVLIILGGAWGWSLFTIVWVFGLIGVLIRLFDWQLPDHISTAPYLVMGWVAIAAIKPMIDHSLMHGWGLLVLLVAGGLSYSLGTIYYNRMDMPYNHTVWHLSVLAGSLCHYLAVLLYVIPF